MAHMAEMERVAERESDPQPTDAYEASIAAMQARAQRAKSGRILVRSADHPWESTRQGRLKYFLTPEVYKDTVLQEWKVFVQDIHRHSGRHTHQGGLVIFVLEGTGYTIMDGERMDWEAGDLMILPLKPGGVEHQHFNNNPDVGCKWLAFINTNWQIATGTMIRQADVASSFDKDK
jgi:mannose-6-phosphate isomerase-like protein (cupin superfamily)